MNNSETNYMKRLILFLSLILSFASVAFAQSDVLKHRIPCIQKAIIPMQPSIMKK